MLTRWAGRALRGEGAGVTETVVAWAPRAEQDTDVGLRVRAGDARSPWSLALQPSPAGPGMASAHPHAAAPRGSEGSAGPVPPGFWPAGVCRLVGRGGTEVVRAQHCECSVPLLCSLPDGNLFSFSSNGEFCVM